MNQHLQGVSSYITSRAPQAQASRGRPRHLLSVVAFARGAVAVLLALISLAVVPRAAFGQTNYYVDPVCGNNFNNGLTPGTAWRSVNFALTGPHAPVPSGTTINMLGGVYSAATSEAFPWVLSTDISLVAVASVCAGGGPAVVVDGGSSSATPKAVIYDSAQTNGNVSIRGVTFRNLGTAIELAPMAGAHQALLEGCSFNTALVVGVSIPTANGQVSANIRMNTFTAGTSVRAISSSLGRLEFKYNTVNTSGLEWISSTGTLEFTNNTFAATFGYYGCSITGGLGSLTIAHNSFEGSLTTGLSIQGFGGDFRIIDNTITSGGGTGIFLTGATWNAASRIEGNEFTPTVGGITGIHVSIPNAVVADNTCSRYTFGIDVRQSRVTIRGNRLSQNATGIRVAEAATDVSIARNTITGSTSRGLDVIGRLPSVVENVISGGAVGITDSRCDGSVYCRNLVVRNSGRGFELTASSAGSPPMIHNNTVADNGGCGIYRDPSSAPPDVVNTIIWGNNGAGCDICGLAIGQYRYCDVQDCASPSNGNISQDPLFVDPIAMDYRLLGGSPCIDAGDPGSSMDCDGTIADMGALPTGVCGSAFCFGDGTGTQCPCGNAGATGRGCENSFATGGGLLTAQGAASISCDTIDLVASGLPSTTPTLFFQGTGAAGGGLGTAFGDGLRCVDGAVVRLGTRIAEGGTVTYPGPADLSVSSRGGVPSGAVRYYQAWYRNSAAFCTPSTFNLTNGLSILWAL